METDRPFFDLVRRQRACRRFSTDPVDDDTVAAVLEAATYAPSAENTQPWEFVVVRDREARRRIAEVMRRAWEGGGREFARQHLDERILADVDAGVAGGFEAAPVHVVVGADTDRCIEVAIPESIFPALQNLLLAATALGLGSALTTMATYLGDDLRTIVALPDPVRPMAVVPLGHPARPLGPPRREPFAAHAHRDRFGEPW